MKPKRPLAEADEADAKRNNVAQNITELLARAVTDCPVTVVLTDAEGTIQYVNNTFNALTGYALSEVIGKNSSLLKSGLMLGTCYQRLWHQLRKGRVWHGEFHNRKKNGEHYWEKASISPVQDSTGRVCHYLKIAEDITLQKQLESDLQASYETLKANEAQLQQTCKQLEATTQALKRSERKLHRLSQEDALTGLLNRRGFAIELRRLKSLLERESHGAGFGYLIIDIDHFKRINDQHGHATGDHILKACAKLLRSILRTSDLICRYGGDEIVIALPYADAETTHATAERILKTVRQHDFKKGRVRLSITISIGASCWKPPPGPSLETVMKQADQALYIVKAYGRDGVAYGPSTNGHHAAPGCHDLAVESSGTRKRPSGTLLKLLTSLLDARGQATGDHSTRVAHMAGTLARALSLSPAEVDRTMQGALLHDIGKITIPESLLLKPGRLTAAERRVIRKHPQAGHDILQANPDFDGISQIILSYQEHFDGTGYPQGLKGAQICIGARICAVADAYYVIRIGRPYAAPRSAEEALREIKRCRGTQFDPDVVDALMRHQEELEAILKRV